MRRAKWVLATVILACYSISASAAVVTYQGVFEVSYTLPPLPFTGFTDEFAIGDQFNFRFSIDDSIVDSSAVSNFGNFEDSVMTGFSLTRNPANTGTWDPGGGTVGATNKITTLDAASVDKVSVFLQDSLSGFPDAGGKEMILISFVFNGQTGLLNDTGSGMTLAQLANGALDLTSFTEASDESLLGFEQDGEQVSVRGTISNFSIVPIPATAWLFGSGLIGLSALARRKQN